MTNSAQRPSTKNINGVEYKIHYGVVHLQSKIHFASPNRSVRDGGGNLVAHPLCGQRSRRFYPSHPVRNDAPEVNCEKCLNIKANG